MYCTSNLHTVVKSANLQKNRDYYTCCIIEWLEIEFAIARNTYSAVKKSICPFPAPLLFFPFFFYTYLSHIKDPDYQTNFNSTQR